MTKLLAVMGQGVTGEVTMMCLPCLGVVRGNGLGIKDPRLAASKSFPSFVLYSSHLYNKQALKSRRGVPGSADILKHGFILFPWLEDKIESLHEELE